jgi:myo-inositol-1-phosphate synthase
MQIKIDFVCRDSILAAPLVLDLVLSRPTGRYEGHTGMAFFLLQGSKDSSGILPGAQHIHQEHASLDAR